MQINLHTFLMDKEQKLLVFSMTEMSLPPLITNLDNSYTPFHKIVLHFLSDTRELVSLEL